MNDNNKFRAARLAAGLTQVALGRRARMPQESISLIESGYRVPRLKTIRRISKALGVAPETLL